MYACIVTTSLIVSQWFVILKISSAYECSQGNKMYTFYLFVVYLSTMLLALCIVYRFDWQEDAIKWCGRELLWLIWGPMPAFAWREWGKPMKNLIYDSRFPGWDLNPWPREYRTGVTPTQLTCSVIYILMSQILLDLNIYSDGEKGLFHWSQTPNKARWEGTVLLSEIYSAWQRKSWKFNKSTIA